MRRNLILALAPLVAAVAFGQAPPKVSDDALGTQPYDRYERPQACATCHVDIARQHEQAMMSQAFIHPWMRSSTSSWPCPTRSRSPRWRG